jgi:N-acetylglucosamine kinase-like BadF-type ATPase
VNLYLGIDIGGTGTRWAITDESGETMARGTAPGATGHLFAAVERGRFAALVASLAADLPSPLAGLHAGVTGLGADAHAAARVLLGDGLGLAPTHIGLSDDVELAFRSVFAPGGGHLVAAGTGSIGVHLTADGRAIRVGGRGILVDDGGSGSWIALNAIDRLYRLIDENGSPEGAEQLAGALDEAVGGGGWDAMRRFVYSRDRGAIGTLATAVAAAARQGDSLAAAVLIEAAGELARLGRALLRRVGPLPLAYTGGVLDLAPSIAEELRRTLPEADIRFPTPDAPLAASRLAREAWAQQA